MRRSPKASWVTLACALSMVELGILLAAAESIMGKANGRAAGSAASLNISRRFGIHRSYKIPASCMAGSGGGYPGHMVKFLIGLVTGVALVFLSVILLFVVALRFRESAPV